MEEIKNKKKRNLNVLDDKISDIFEKLDVNVTTMKLKYRFCEKPHNFEKRKRK